MTTEPTADITTQDQQALERLDNKLKLVRDRIRGVAGGYSPGLYLYGAADLGRSVRVTRQLEEDQVAFRVFNLPMSAEALYWALAREPSVVHVLEDMERLSNDRPAQSVLRSALWTLPNGEREVTRTKASGDAAFAFKGGIIMLANRPLAHLPELRALASRIAVHKLDVTEVEMAAHVRRVARSGFVRGKHQLDAEQCLAVAEYVIKESRRLMNCPLDLHLYENACLDYLQWDAGCAACHWQDLVEKRIRRTGEYFLYEPATLSREEQQAADRELVRQLCQEIEGEEERVRRWKQSTGRSQATFYRRKREIDMRVFE
jgi:hypothetical protein